MKESGRAHALPGELRWTPRPGWYCNLHSRHDRTLHFATWGGGLDWLPGHRSADHFPTRASQDCQRAVVAGKAVAGFSGEDHLELPFQRQPSRSVHGTPHAKGMAQTGMGSK